MIGTSISASRFDPRDIKIIIDKGLEEIGQPAYTRNSIEQLVLCSVVQNEMEMRGSLTYFALVLSVMRATVSLVPFWSQAVISY